MPVPNAPNGLGTVGKKVWKAVLAEYSLRPDELRVLEHACREEDLIERLAKALDSDELVVSGSMGQPVVNGLVDQLSKHRSTAARLYKQLGLSDDSASGSRSTSARAAAKARWGGVA